MIKINEFTNSQTLKIEDWDMYSAWVVQQFGAFLRFGGTFEQHARCRKHVRKLAKHFGESVESIKQLIVDRWEETAV